MRLPEDKRIILVGGAVAAIVAAVALALVFGGDRGQAPTAAPPAAMGGLNIDLAEAPALEPTRQLRCFVNGQFVGLATLADCAQKNGLATDALDVGLDETGALAAAPTAAFAPPPVLPTVKTPAPAPVEIASSEPDRPAAPVAAPAPAGSPCLRFTGSEWRTVSHATSQSACVKALYDGYCVQRPGDAQYGRWGEVTLRLVPRRVEQSNDNNRFRVLAEQDRTCHFPGL